MGMAVGKVNIEYLPRPQGLAYEFIKELACVAGCEGDGKAFGFYLRDEMDERAKEFAKEFAKSNELAELRDWIASLPWDEDGYLALTFNW